MEQEKTKHQLQSQKDTIDRQTKITNLKGELNAEKYKNDNIKNYIEALKNKSLVDIKRSQKILNFNIALSLISLIFLIKNDDMFLSEIKMWFLDRLDNITNHLMYFIIIIVAIGALTYLNNKKDIIDFRYTLYLHGYKKDTDLRQYKRNLTINVSLIITLIFTILYDKIKIISTDFNIFSLLLIFNIMGFLLVNAKTILIAYIKRFSKKSKEESQEDIESIINVKPIQKPVIEEDRETLIMPEWKKEILDLRKDRKIIK